MVMNHTLPKTRFFGISVETEWVDLQPFVVNVLIFRPDPQIQNY